MDISTKLRKGQLPQGYELQESDIGQLLSVGEGFGRVQPIDVGKRVFLRDGIFQMENNEQRDKRRLTS